METSEHVQLSLDRYHELIKIEKDSRATKLLSADDIENIDNIIKERNELKNSIEYLERKSSEFSNIREATAYYYIAKIEVMKNSTSKVIDDYEKQITNLKEKLERLEHFDTKAETAINLLNNASMTKLFFLFFRRPYLFGNGFVNYVINYLQK